MRRSLDILAKRKMMYEYEKDEYLIKDYTCTVYTSTGQQHAGYVYNFSFCVLKVQNDVLQTIGIIIFLFPKGNNLHLLIFYLFIIIQQVIEG